MIAGGKCSYPLGNQLAQAVDFLRPIACSLRHASPFGGDDVLGPCTMRDGSIIICCPEQGLVAKLRP